jgi:hypothetical protein
MDGPVIPLRPTNWVLGTLLFFGSCCATNEVLAQTQTPGGSGKSTPADAPKDKAANARKTDGRRAGADPAAGGAGRAAQPSAEYQASLRQTVERRRQRRARRQQNAADTAGTVGAIVPWPMPPALIIRHTSDVHGEVGSLLYGLRR